MSLGDAPPGASRSIVDAGRFRTFTWLRIRNAPDVVAVEIARSYGPIVAESERMWQPWVVRALAAAALFGLLAAATATGAAVTQRRRASRKEAEEASAPPRSRWTPDLPEYMRQGYRQEVEARRRLEEEQLLAALKAAAAPPTPDAVTLPDAPTIPAAPQEHEDLEARLRRIAREREREEDAVGTPA
jgi:hypothetical protein